LKFKEKKSGMGKKQKNQEKTEIKQVLDDPELEENEILSEDIETDLEDLLDDELEELSSEEQIEVLQKSLDEMKTKADEYLEGWQRSRAEFANYKKRILRENSDIRTLARGEVIKNYLEIVDDLERALQEKPHNGEAENWAEGIEIIYQKLCAKLEAEGVRPMNALGEDFDPNIHEALMKEESEEFESGQIIEVMQEGYWIGDKVLRPALVRVAA
jgi:molecular chaperone GrpE